MTIQQIEYQFRRQQGIPLRAVYIHPSHPPRFPPFEIHLPVLFVPWNEGNVLAFIHPRQQQPLLSIDATVDESSNIGRCRCGVVRYGVIYNRRQMESGGQYEVAVKIMSNKQVQVQGDSTADEINVMAALQSRGFNGNYNSPHISQWDFISDTENGDNIPTNEYIAMDYAANGSLIQYVGTRLNEYNRFAHVELTRQLTDLTALRERVLEFTKYAWLSEALYIFYNVMKGIAYMHSRNVCHLDIDPCNIVIDRNYVARIIDFGSSEIMNENGIAGANDRLVKFKPLFVAPEVRRHNRHAIPRPGFAGRSADMWSCGVLLYQLLCFGYPKGHFALVYDEANWRSNLMAHVNNEEGGCLGEQACFICFRDIELPPFICEIFRGLLIRDSPSERMEAAKVVELLDEVMEGYNTNFGERCQAVMEDIL